MSHFVWSPAAPSRKCGIFGAVPDSNTKQNDERPKKNLSKKEALVFWTARNSLHSNGGTFVEFPLNVRKSGIMQRVELSNVDMLPDANEAKCCPPHSGNGCSSVSGPTDWRPLASERGPIITPSRVEDGG